MLFIMILNCNAEEVGGGRCIVGWSRGHLLNDFLLGLCQVFKVLRVVGCG